MNLDGLSADQGPSVDAPLMLISLMPAFLTLTGLLLVWQWNQILSSRWAPPTLATTHLLVLGSLTPVMCGVLLQIAHVLLGAPYLRPPMVARLTAGGLGIGSLLLCIGFLSMNAWILILGGIATAAGLAVFLPATAYALTAITTRRETLWSLRIATSALVLTITLGLLLVLVRAGWIVSSQHNSWVNSHATWGLAGWLGLLLARVGMELIPMFYLSASFPVWLKRCLPMTLLSALLLITGLLLDLPMGMTLLCVCRLLSK